jgi:hypothetical protein
MPTIQPRLSILIPALWSRRDMLDTLRAAGGVPALGGNGHAGT